jgi:hypothetical protein
VSRGVWAVRCGSGRGRPVLRCLRCRRGGLPVVWWACLTGRPVLPFLRAPAVSFTYNTGADWWAGAGGGAASVLGAVLRRGGVHPAVGSAGSRGSPGAAVAVLHGGADGDRPVRRGGGEVHRGRGDGGVGHPRRGGRGRRAGGARRARPGGRGGRAGRRKRGSRFGGPSRGGHRGGGGHPGRRGRRHGGGGCGEHRRAGAGGGRTWIGAGGRGDAAPGGNRDRVCRCRGAFFEGQGRAGPVVAGDEGAGRGGRLAAGRWAGGAADRPGRRAAHDQGAVSRVGGAAGAAAGTRGRPGRCREVAAGVGV